MFTNKVVFEYGNCSPLQEENLLTAREVYLTQN